MLADPDGVNLRCPRGHPVSEEQRVCPLCGAALVHPAAAASEEAAPRHRADTGASSPSRVTAMNPGGPPRGHRRAVLGALCLLLLGGSSAAVVAFQDGLGDSARTAARTAVAGPSPKAEASRTRVSGAAAPATDGPPMTETQSLCRQVTSNGLASAFAYLVQSGHSADAAPVWDAEFPDPYFTFLRVMNEAFYEQYNPLLEAAGGRPPDHLSTAYVLQGKVYTSIYSHTYGRPLRFVEVHDLATNMCMSVHPSALPTASPPAAEPPASPAVEPVNLTPTQEEGCRDLEMIFHDWFSNGIEAGETKRRMGQHAAAFDAAINEMGELTGAPEDEDFGMNGIRRYCAANLS